MKRISILMAVVAATAAVLAAVYWWMPPGEAATTEPKVADTASPISRLSVKLSPARRSPIQAWVFAEGTSRSVQREYLTFEATGRVTFVGPEKPGVRVKSGEVLATLDKRTFVADVDAALATIEDAKTQVEAALSDADQAKTSATLEQRQYERAQSLYRQNASSREDLEQAKAAMENAQSAVEASKARAERSTQTSPSPRRN